MRETDLLSSAFSRGVLVAPSRGCSRGRARASSILTMWKKIICECKDCVLIISPPPQLKTPLQNTEIEASFNWPIRRPLIKKCWLPCVLINNLTANHPHNTHSSNPTCWSRQDHEEEGCEFVRMMRGGRGEQTGVARKRSVIELRPESKKYSVG